MNKTRKPLRIMKKSEIGIPVIMQFYAKYEAVIALVFLAVAIAIPAIVNKRYITNIMVNCATYSVLALSLNLLAGVMGTVSLGHAAFYGIGAYTAAMNGLDAVVFTAGIGENNPVIRYEVCKNMEYLGIKFDEAKNNSLARGETAEISAPDSKVRVFTIATDEEYMIAQDTAALV